jgi:hypothetical protein
VVQVFGKRTYLVTIRGEIFEPKGAENKTMVFASLKVVVPKSWNCGRWSEFSSGFQIFQLVITKHTEMMRMPTINSVLFIPMRPTDGLTVPTNFRILTECQIGRDNGHSEGELSPSSGLISTGFRFSGCSDHHVHHGRLIRCTEETTQIHRGPKGRPVPVGWGVKSSC